ncbi:hypothetical protein [Marinibacterium sp. SX1]|uniref:hypothetical protein n=1 Tax=Marinibacterium sp. SX1 TaxID=3388424 RepID=UPI003D17B7B3
MDVILHIGVHRTGTTTFQTYLRERSDMLADQGLAFWGPRRTRNGLFHGIHGQGAGSGARFRRATGRIALNIARSRDRGRAVLLVSDENMSGSVCDNLRAGGLYPGIGERLTRVHIAFGGKVDQVVLTIRSLDHYWSSALGYGLTRGQPLPDADRLDRLVTAPRSWRDVIADVACAMPDARIRVAPFETLGGRPDALLAEILGRPAPRDDADLWLNRTPGLAALRRLAGEGPQSGALLPEGEGRWHPFDPAQAAALRETYQDDLFWLAAGADGLAETMAYAAPGPARQAAHGTGDSLAPGADHATGNTRARDVDHATDPARPAGLAPPSTKTEAEPNPPVTDMTRGRSNDSQQRRMAPHRRR